MTVVRKKQRGPDGKNVRREADNEAKAVLKMVRISPRKLNLVAQSIRGLRAEKAVNELTFSRKRISDDVLKCLQSAIANAENNHNADIDTLKVARIEIDEAPTFKRFHARAKGRGNRIVKRNSHITILVGDGRKD